MINIRIHDVTGSNTHLAKGTSNECARELIHKDQARQNLRGSLLEGAASAPADPADAAYFEGLRRRAGGHGK
jgi:antitoxin ParD1/3/4